MVSADEFVEFCEGAPISQFDNSFIANHLALDFLGADEVVVAGEEEDGDGNIMLFNLSCHFQFQFLLFVCSELNRSTLESLLALIINLFLPISIRCMRFQIVFAVSRCIIMYCAADLMHV